MRRSQMSTQNRPPLARWITSVLAATSLSALAGAALAADGASSFSGPTPAQTAHPSLWPQTASPAALTDPQTEAMITSLLATMTLEEKVGQTIQGDIASIRPADLAHYPLGSILAGGNDAPNGDNRGSPADWLTLIASFKAAALAAGPGRHPIPLMFGIDAVHGHNKMRGATLFPHNIGLGAAHDPQLIREIGRATAEEVAATGVDWTFGPTLATPQDVHWGRSYEGYSEDPSVVAAYAGEMTLGLQGELLPGQPLAPGHIVGSAKHFLADGGTDKGKDQGDAKISEDELIRVHNGGYPPAISAGILTVMASFSSWNGLKTTANATLLTDVLKGRMGFQGFIVGDWNAHGQLPGCTTTDCPLALNSGLDMYMAPDSWRGLFDATVAEVRAGTIPQSRLDDAVRRILRVKLKAGLFTPKTLSSDSLSSLGAPAHRELARRAVRESLVLIKNNATTLPIRGGAHVLVAGDGADNIGKQSGGWTLTWQGTGNSNADFPGATSIYAGLKAAIEHEGGQVELTQDGTYQQKPDIAVVVFGEDPYAEFQGDIDTLEFQPGAKSALSLLRKLKAQGLPVVAVFLSGRPLWLNPEINAADAVVAAWLPGTEGEGVADVLVGDVEGRPRFDFKGRLSFSWPKRADRIPRHVGEAGYDPQFPLGYGLDYAHPALVPQLSEEGGSQTATQNRQRFFNAGRFEAPWAYSLAGAVALRPIDAGGQENARRLTWSGAGLFAVTGEPVDLSRQATGDMAISLRYRLASPLQRPLRLGLNCAQTCKASVDITDLLTKTPVGQWGALRVKLSCFRSLGADLAHVTQPVTLAADAGVEIDFKDISVVANEGDAVCPK